MARQQKEYEDYVIRAVANAVSVVEFLAKGAQGVSDIARHLETNKNNAFRQLASLVSLGWVRADENGQYSLSSKFAGMALRWAAQNRMEEVKDFLQIASQRFELTTTWWEASAAEEDASELEFQCVDGAEFESPLIVRVPLGQTVSLPEHLCHMETPSVLGKPIFLSVPSESRLMDVLFPVHSKIIFGTSLGRYDTVQEACFGVRLIATVESSDQVDAMVDDLNHLAEQRLGRRFRD